MEYNLYICYVSYINDMYIHCDILMFSLPCLNITVVDERNNFSPMINVCIIVSTNVLMTL